MKMLAQAYRHHFIGTSFELVRPADEQACRPQPGMIRIVARGAGLVADTVARAAADKCIRTGNRPLLLLNSMSIGHYKKILVATDFSEASRQAAAAAVRIFPDAQIVFLHALHVPDQTTLRNTADAFVSPGRIASRQLRTRERAVTELDRFVDALEVKRQLISRVVRSGAPMRAICNYARTMSADLIAIGNPAQPRLKTLLHGGVTRRLMDETDCDLLIAPAQRR